MNIGVFFVKFGEVYNKELFDLYFNGDGLRWNICYYCGSCMIGCCYNVKNILMKNYLYFVECNGVEIRFSFEVIKIILFNVDGSVGYKIKIKDISYCNNYIYMLIICGVVLSVGVMGIVFLFLKMCDKDKILFNILVWFG